MPKALKHFLRTQTAMTEQNAVAREILTSPPRAGALVSAAFLDHHLRDLILLNLLPLSENDAEALFDPDRPLGTFSAKIKIAKAMGIIGPKTAHDLNLLREIRNAFAHGLRKMNLDTPQIKLLIGSFHCIKDIDDFRRLSPRKRFVEITAVLLTHIQRKKAISKRPHRVHDGFFLSLD